MSKVVREASRIMPVIGELIPCRVSQHVRMDAPGTVASPLRQRVEPSGGTKPLSLACPPQSRTHKGLRLGAVAAHEAWDRVGDAHLRSRPSAPDLAIRSASPVVLSRSYWARHPLGHLPVFR